MKYSIVVSASVLVLAQYLALNHRGHRNNNNNNNNKNDNNNMNNNNVTTYNVKNTAAARSHYWALISNKTTATKS